MRDFSAARPLPLPNSLPLREVLARSEQDPVRRSALERARQRAAATLYAGERPTLAYHRLSAGLSQAELAARARTSQSHIARIEAGTIDPGTDLICRIADALSLPAAAVFEAICNQQHARPADT